jgi:hypothetical protein
MLTLSFLLYAHVCTANEDLSICKAELTNLADRIELTLVENPKWSTLFVINERPVSSILFELADKLSEKFYECPCIGACTDVDDCNNIKSNSD